MTINAGPVKYKGEDLDPERGPGLGCFRFQLVVLAVFVVLTPLSVAWNWPLWISSALLFAVILLLLVAGQTVIFLLRLVAADRRGRRRPLAGATKTVGELADADAGSDVDLRVPGGAQDSSADASVAPSDDDPPGPPLDEGSVRQ